MEQRTFKIKNQDVELEANLYIDDDNYEVKYIHPLTSSENEYIEQCFFNWNEKNDKEQKKWDELVEKWNVNNIDIDLIELIIWANREVIDLTELE